VEITKVNIRLLNDDSESSRRLKAIASITFDNMLTVNDILVVQAWNRMCICFPENQYHETTVVPRVRDFSKQIESAIIERYNHACKTA
jgi:DNA-binding cell septation regulator SpoVG